MTTTSKIRLSVGDSTRGYTSVTIRNGKVVEQLGLKYLCKRMVQAYKRGERSVLTSAGDELLMRVE